MIAVVVSFLFGICFLHFFPNLPSQLWVILSLFILIGLTCHSFFRTWKIQWALAFGMGFFWALIHAQAITRQILPEALEGVPVVLTGTIATLPDIHHQSYRFEVDVFKTPALKQWSDPGRIRLHWYKGVEKTTLKVGDVWQWTVKLKRPHAYSNPGSFDSERHLFQNKIMAEGRVLDKFPFVLQSSSLFSHPIDRFRGWLNQRITSLLNSKPHSGIIRALVIGTRDGITPAQWAVFRNTGTAHLMCISGLHIGLVAGFAYWIMGLVWRCLPKLCLIYPKSCFSAWGALTISTFYAVLSGFSVPAQRALIMILLFMIGTVLKRSISPWRSYAIALGIVLVWDPLTTLSPGFWLSFGAVGILMYGMQGRLHPQGLWWRWGRAQWVIFLGLIPISLAAFQQLSLVSPIANIIAIPWVSFLVVPSSLIGAFIGVMNDTLAQFFLNIAESLFSMIGFFLEKLNDLPKASWAHAPTSFLSIALAMIGILWVLAPRGFPGRHFGWFWMLPLFFGKVPEIPENTARLTLLDVGQGLSVVVETQHHLMVFDTGPKLGEHFDTGERVILPFLQTRGRTIIDKMIISHGDNDHIGGAKSLMSQLEIKEVITSEPELFQHKRVSACIPGHHWEWDGVKFKVLHPETVQTRKRNDHSCVIHIQAGKHAALLTGDIESKSEAQILAREGRKIQASILLVPHHGSRTSSSLPFIQAVNPLYAIIPAGYRNQYGHPKEDIVARYVSQGITVLDTIKSGAITFHLNTQAHLMPPEQYRLTHKQYWHL